MVEFKKRKISNTSSKVTKNKRQERYKKRYSKRTPKRTGFWVKTLLYLLFFGILIISIGLYMLYVKYIKPLPPTDELENMNIPEASIIYDNKGDELYTLYTEEKRTYVSYESISQNMINAIVAGEDKNFFNNKGVDFYRMTGAVFDYVVGKKDKIEGTSTISQQLIRNTLIGSERKVERKVKEIYLSYKMNTKIAKTKILELYLNKISFGSNAFGIEQAAKTFFGKSAKDLTPLEGSILASLPKGPTYFSPYRHFDRLMGSPYVYNKESPEETTNIITQKDTVLNSGNLQVFKDILSGLKGKRLNDKELLLCGILKENYNKSIRIDSDGCKIFKYSDLLGFLNNLIVIGDDNILEYQTGRKDFILGRMLEDNYIDFDEYKKSLLASIGFTFTEYRENIKYPHFVFFVKDYIEEKYGQDLIDKGGLKIFTSIDPVLQDKAEELVTNGIIKNKASYGAGNAALVSIDNRTGEIVTMVGGGDYYDTENKGNVNIVTSSLQPGSSFKPFVYALAIEKNPIGTNTPVYDVKTTFPGTPTYTPSNFDGKFMGKMSLSTALNHSRNIPAIKMYYLAGGQGSIVEFLNTLGASSLKSGQYGPSLALGTGLMTPLDLAKAYSVFANMGNKIAITPIVKIEDGKGNIIEELKKDNIKKEQVIDASLAYIMNYMLSNTKTRPSFWNTYLSLNGRKVAAKTGTSTFQYKENGISYKFPRNLWTAGYTPQYTTVVWAGNTDGKPLNNKGNGLEGAGPIWKSFMDFVHSDEDVVNWIQPKGVKQVNISNISGYLPSEGFDEKYLVSSLFRNLPNKYDNSLKETEYDILCRGKVSEKTPPRAIKKGVFIALNSLQPQLPSWELPVQLWGANGGITSIIGKNIGNILTEPIGQEICSQRDQYKKSEIEIGIDIDDGAMITPGARTVNIGFRNTNPIRDIVVYVAGVESSNTNTKLKSKGVINTKLYIPNTTIGVIEIKIVATDSLYYSKEKIITVNVGKDESDPIIEITNPSDSKIKLYQDDFFNLRAQVTDESPLRAVNVLIDGKIKLAGSTNSNLIFVVNENKDLTLGEHTIIIEAIDHGFNKSSKKILVEVIEK